MKLYMHLTEVKDLDSQKVFLYMVNKTPSLLYKLFLCFGFHVLLFFPHVVSFLREGKQDVEQGWVSYRDGMSLLVTEHRLDHLTTTDGENGEQRITQL
jgi:hypothetical protein